MNNDFVTFQQNDWNIDNKLLFFIPFIILGIIIWAPFEWLEQGLLLISVIFLYNIVTYKERLTFGFSGIRIASIPSAIVVSFTVFIAIPSIYILVIKDHPRELHYFYAIILFYLFFPMGLYMGNSIRSIDQARVRKLLCRPIENSENDKKFYEILLIIFSLILIIFSVYLIRVDEIPLLELIQNPGNSTKYFYMREEALKLLESTKIERYMFFWLRSLFIPFGIIGSLYLMKTYKKNKYKLLFYIYFVSGLLINSITLEKSPVAIIFVAIGIFYLLKNNHISFRFILAMVVIILAGPLLITYLLIIDRTGIFEIIFWSYINRLFVIPTEVLFYYFEIFPDIHPFLLGRSSQLFSWMHAEGTFPTANYVAKIWWNMPDTSGSANAVYIANFWADFGWIGVIISTFIIGMITHLLQWKIFQVCDYKKNILFIICLSVAIPSFTFGFISANFTIIFFTKGLILLTFFLFIFDYLKKYYFTINKSKDERILHLSK